MPAQTPENLMPVLALRGLVVFPGMLLHFDVGREKSVNAINKIGRASCRERV